MRRENPIVTVVLEAYADESGIEGSGPYCVVAGYIGSPRHWDSFNAAWRKVIDEAREDGVTEFKGQLFFGRRSRKSASRNNPFARWPERKARQFLDDLLGIIHDHKARITRCSAALNVKDFNSFTWGERQYFTGGTWDFNKSRFLSSGQPTRVYTVPLNGFIGDALLHARPEDCKVTFTFDEQPVLQEGVIQTIAQLRKRGVLDDPVTRKVGSLHFEVSEDWPGIQAGDMLAHLLYSNALRREALGKERRYALTSLMGGDSWKSAIYDRENLQLHLERKFSPDILAQIQAVKSPAEIQRGKKTSV